jgi:hypothetical protein
LSLPSPQSESLDVKRWIGLIIVGLLLGQGAWMVVVSLTKNVLVPLMAMAMGGDATSPLSLGKPDFNFPEIFTAVLQLCVAGIVAICLNFFLLRRPKTVAVSSLSLTPSALPQPAHVAAPVAQKAPVRAPATEPVAAPPAAAQGQQIPSWATTTAEVSIKPTPLAGQGPIVVPPQTVPAKTAPVAAPQTAVAQPQVPVSRPAVPPSAVPPPQVPASRPTAPPPAVPPPAATRPQPPAPVAAPAPPPQPKQPPTAKPKKPKEVYYNIVGERITPEDDE